MKTFFTIVASIATVTSFAQDVKFGKISKQDFEKIKSTIQADAPAEVLYSEGDYKVTFNTHQGGVEQTKKVFYRYIVFDKDKTPNDILTISIPIYKTEGSDQDKLLSLKAVTYNLENGKIVQQKLEKKDIFLDKVHRFLDKQTFTFPNVKNGSILEYSYEILSPFISSTDTWYFQQSVPVVNSNFTFQSQDYFNYQQDLRGSFSPKITKDSKEDTYTSTVYNRGLDPSMNAGVVDRSSTIQNGKLKINTLSYSLTNLPTYSKEPYVLNHKNMLSSLQFELASYKQPGQTPQNFSTTWEKIGKDLMDNSNLGRELTGNNFLDETVKTLTANKNTDLEKTEAIFEYVKNNFTWNDYLSVFTDNGIRKTFNDKTGNSADINLLLISMLKKAGINVNPIVLSSLNNGLINYSFPSRTKLNYVIAGATINNEFYLIDATDKNSQLNLLPLRAINDRGIMLLENGIKEIPLRNSVMTNNKKTITADLKADGTLTGSFTNLRDNYFYMADKNEIASDPKAFQKEYVDGYNFEISDFKSQDNKINIIRHQFKFSDANVDVAGNKIIFNPLLFLANTKYYLNLEQRNYNIEFGAPITTVSTVNIKIPAGYKVEALPVEKQFTMQDQASGYAYKVVEKDGYIVAQSYKITPYSVLPPSYYKPLKEFSENIIKAESQQVILVKE
ncbi:transglutaminase domain-containing protein [Chishuiella sp.]|uniref:transglutaminase domain-containing protein n=1 Tax=Chishuiella sp. TaxID=1969467 RepID=UPI0028AC3969|nr:transglutaminase domain-containing protein [Chishuiella sp.]